MTATARSALSTTAVSAPTSRDAVPMSSVVHSWLSVSLNVLLVFIAVQGPSVLSTTATSALSFQAAILKSSVVPF